MSSPSPSASFQTYSPQTSFGLEILAENICFLVCSCVLLLIIVCCVRVCSVCFGAQMRLYEQQQQQALAEQAGALAGSPMVDPSKNPALERGLNDEYDRVNGEQAIQTEEGA